jgi:hypothetical protein
VHLQADFVSSILYLLGHEVEVAGVCGASNAFDSWSANESRLCGGNTWRLRKSKSCTGIMVALRPVKIG